jgi:HSP20 family molecular chaperone IbpA
MPRQQAFAGQNFQTAGTAQNFTPMSNAWSYRFQPTATAQNRQQASAMNQGFVQPSAQTGTQFSQRPAAPTVQATNTVLQPSIDISETKDDLVIACNMQNVDTNNLNLTATEDSLSISAQSYVGSQPTSLHKTIPLPTSIRSEAVSADYSNGILNIRMPKKDASARQQLQVNVSDQ